MKEDFKRTTLVLSKKQDQALEIHCMVKGKTRNDLILEALEEYFKNHKKEAINFLNEFQSEK